MRKCGKISKPRMSRCARFWVASDSVVLRLMWFPLLKNTVTMNQIFRVVKSWDCLVKIKRLAYAI